MKIYVINCREKESGYIWQDRAYTTFEKAMTRIENRFPNAERRSDKMIWHTEFDDIRIDVLEVEE